jgi:hypothetical protein
MWIAMLADAIPIPLQTVAGKLARVVRQADVDVATVACQIVNAMRDERAVCPTGKVMIERLERLARADSSSSKEFSHSLLRFGVHRKARIASRLIGLDQFGDPQKLRVTILRRPSSAELFQSARAFPVR